MNDNPDWKENQKKLLRDIEAFARSEPDLTAIEAAGKARPVEFAVAAAGAATPRPAARALPKAAVDAAATTTVAPQPPGGSLLDRLKREAQVKQMTESQIFSVRGQQRHCISEALQRTFQYLRELCEQINILKPPYPATYSLLGLVAFEDLSWQEGRADFRLVPAADEERVVDQVTLRFRLASGQQIRVERENPAHETFRAALRDANIAFKEEEFRNQKSHIERAVYTFPAEVKAGLVFAADYKAGDIRLLLRNIRRFGAAEYRLPYEILDQAAFEELGRLVLGEECRAEKMFRRVA